MVRDLVCCFVLLGLAACTATQLGGCFPAEREPAVAGERWPLPIPAKRGGCNMGLRARSMISP